MKKESRLPWSIKISTTFSLLCCIRYVPACLVCRVLARLFGCLCQIATGMLDVSSISTPFRTLLKKAKNFDFRIGELQAVNPEDNKIKISTGELSYDSLIIATGNKPNFFGMDNTVQTALPRKPI